MGTETGPGQPTSGGDFDQATVELSTADAASGGQRVVSLPPGDHTITVQLPPGTADGATIRLPGAGRPDPAGGPARDLVLTVRVTAPPEAAPPYPAPPVSTPPFAAPPTSGPPHQYPAAGFPQQQYPQAYQQQQYPQAFPQQQYPQAYPQPGMPGQPYPPGFPPPPPPRRGRGRLVAVIGSAVAVVVLLSCCGIGLVIANNDDEGEPGGIGASASAAPSPTSEPVQPADYQAALAAADAKLAAPLKQLAAARTPTAAKTAAAALATAAGSAGADLAALNPPTPVAEPHRAVLSALDNLATAAGETEDAASDQQVCTGSSATALLSRSPAIDELAAAAQQLAAADPAQGYKIGTGLPKETKDTNRRAKNGTFVKRTRGGSGHLKIDNGGTTDSLISVVLRGSKRPAISVYVRAKGKFTVTGVRDGTYSVYMASGVDWDTKLKRYTRNCGFSKFDDTFKFSTTSRQYTIWEITLTPTAGGNASTSGVDPDAFPEG